MNYYMKFAKHKWITVEMSNEIQIRETVLSYKQQIHTQNSWFLLMNSIFIPCVDLNVNFTMNYNYFYIYEYQVGLFFAEWAVRENLNKNAKEKDW